MHITDIGVLLSLSLLEILLSADNAIVLAVVARRLENAALRKRALTIGLMCSFGLRILGLFVASLLIKAWPLRALGAAYLIWVCVRHFARKPVSKGDPGREYVSGPPTFVRIITAIAVMDAAFALDTILVAVAVSNKLWLIYAGVLLGMVGLRIIAGSFMVLLEKYPALDNMAYLLIGWAGMRLGCDAVSMFGDAMYQADWPAMPAWIFWIGMAVIGIFGAAHARTRERRPGA